MGADFDQFDKQKLQSCKRTETGSLASMSARSSASTFCWQNSLVSCPAGRLERNRLLSEEPTSLPLESRAPRPTRTKVVRGTSLHMAQQQLPDPMKQVPVSARID